MRLEWRAKVRKVVERTNRAFISIFALLEAYLFSSAVELSPRADFIHYFIVLNQKITWLAVLLYLGIFLYNFSKIRKKRFILLCRRDVF